MKKRKILKQYFAVLLSVATLVTTVWNPSLAYAETGIDSILVVENAEENNNNTISANESIPTDEITTEEGTVEENAEYKGTSLSDYLMGEAEKSGRSSISTQNESSSDAITETESVISDHAESVQEQEWTIYCIEMNGNQAKVNYSAKDAATIIVGIYSEDGNKLLLTGTKQIDGSETEAIISFDEPIPEYYLLKGFLVDNNTQKPLCQAYSTREYTKETHDFLATTVDDYDPEKVLNLDDDNETNFIVFSDAAILLSDSDFANHMEIADEETGTYTFSNIDDSIRYLNVGSIISYYHDDSNDFDFISVGNIVIDEDTQTAVVTRDDRGLDKLIPYMKIEIKNNQNAAQAYSFTPENDELSCERELGSNNPWTNTVKVHSVAAKLSIGSECFKSYKNQDDLMVNAKVSIEMEISADPKPEESASNDIIGFCFPIATGINFEGKINPSFEGKLTANAKLTGNFHFRYKGGRIQPPEKKFEFIPSGKFDAEIKLGISCELGISILCDELIFVSTSVEPNVKISVSYEFGAKSDLYYHTCQNCLLGEGGVYIDFTALKISLFNKIEITSDNLCKKYNISEGEFYYSVDNDKFGWGKCPYKKYVMNFSIKDEEGNAVPNAKVKVYYNLTDYSAQNECYIKNDTGEIVSEWPVSDEYGEVKNKLYITPDVYYKYVISADGYVSHRENYCVNTDGESQPVVLSTNSGKMGEVNWRFSDDGTLTLEGTDSPQTEWIYNDFKNFDVTSIEVSIRNLSHFDWIKLFKDKLTSVKFVNTTLCENASLKDLFKGCRKITEIDLDGLDTSNAITLYSMFEGCSSLEQLDLSNLNTSKVLSMRGAFYGCKSLTELNLGNIDTGNVTNMWDMFNGCSSLSKLNLDGLNTSNVTDMQGMFEGCSGLTELSLKEIDARKVTNMNKMFYNCSGLTQLDLSTFVTSDDTVNSMNYLFQGCANLRQLNLSGLHTGKVSTMRGAFSGCKSLTELNLGNIDTGNVTNMWDMFNGCSSLSKLNLDGLNTSNVTNMQGMFEGCSGLTELSLKDIDARKVTNMNKMFYNCNGLTQLDLSTFVTSDDTTNSMSNLFRGCTNLTQLNLSGLHTGKVTDMTDMFADCHSLGKLDLSNFKTSNVTNMSNMFHNCYSLTELDLSNFDTSNVTSMNAGTISGGMFAGCKSLTKLDLSGFDTGKVTWMHWMFAGCKSLTELKLGNRFVADQVSDMGMMFQGCSSLTQLDLSNFISSSVKNTSWMFAGCESLTEINLSGSDTSGVSDMMGMFAGCIALTQLDLSSFDTSNVTSMGSIFFSCDNLKQVMVSDKWISSNDFGYEDLLVQVRDGNTAENITSENFTAESITEISGPVVPEMTGEKTDVLSSEMKVNQNISPVDDTGKMEVTVKGLIPNEMYMLYAVENKEAENIVSDNNILYVDQLYTDETGMLQKNYTMKKVYDTPYVFVRGFRGIDISYADIVMQDMVYTGEVLYARPELYYEGNKLVKDQDYELAGNLEQTAPGYYKLIINGIGSFAGSVEVTYQIICNHQYNTEWTVDVAATIDKEGSKSHHCSICGDKKDITAIPKIQKMTDSDTNASQTEPSETEEIDNGSQTDSTIAVGKKMNDDSNKAVYKIKTEKTVIYCKPIGSPKTIMIPDTAIIKGKRYRVVEIAANACKNSKATAIKIGNQVTIIGNNAFGGCKKVKAFIIGKRVKKIGKNAFINCKKLKTVTIKSTSLKTVGKSAFKNIAKNATIKVPKKKLNAYKKLIKKSGISTNVKIKK